MRRAGGAALLGVALAAACDGGGARADAGPEAVFEVDVLAEAAQVTVWLRDLGPPCLTPPHYLPRFGECESYYDGLDITCLPAKCLTSVRLERGGAIVDEVRPSMWMPMPICVGGAGAELVLEECGEPARIALPEPPLAAPSFTDATTDGSQVTVTWGSPPDVSDTIVTMSAGFGASSCRDDFMSTYALGSSTPATWEIRVTALAPASELAADVGPVRVWNASRASLSRLRSPRIESDGRLALPSEQTDRADVEIVVDGTVDSGELRVQSALIDTSGAAPLVELVAEPADLPISLEYRAGAMTDHLAVQLVSGRYVADLPHVAPVDDVDLGLPGNGFFELALGPVTMAAESDPATTVQVSLTLRWELGIVARPIAP